MKSANIKSVKYLMGLVWKENKLSYFYMLINPLFYSINVFVLVLLPKYVINALDIDYDRKKALTVLVLFVSIQFLLSVLSDLFNKKSELLFDKIRSVLGVTAGRHSMNARLYELDNPERRNDYSFAQKCIDRNSAKIVFNEIGGILSGIILLISLSLLISGLSVFVIAFSLLLIILQAYVQAKLNKRRYEYDRDTELLSRKLYYSVSGITNMKYGKDARMFQLSRFMTAKYDEGRSKIYRMMAKFTKTEIKINIVPVAVSAMQNFVVYGYMAFLLYRKIITVGDFTMYVSGMFQLSKAVKDLFSSCLSIVNESHYVSCYIDILKSEEVKNQTSPICEVEDIYVKFENVCFKYDNRDDYALKDVNVEIFPRERISVVGLNGAGKTTFVKLLMGLYRPTSGKISLNGMDIENFCQNDLMKIFAPVYQDFTIFDYTIKENVAFAEDDNNRLRNAFMKINLFDKVDRLQQKQDSYITKNLNDTGVDFSGGERQKLALARAIYKDAPFFVLDEPTAALSPRSEFEIYHHFNTITKDKSVIFISHRLASCQFSDRIMVFLGGEIVEEGTHDDLIGRKGQYFELFEKQASLYKEGGNMDEEN